MAARFLSETRLSFLIIISLTHIIIICLQGTGKTLVYLQDAIETVKEINNHICFSPKRFHLLSSNFV